MSFSHRHSMPCQAVLALVGVVLLSGCAGDYVARTRQLRTAYESESYEFALAELDAVARQDTGKDTLLVLLDRGMVLHAAGRWRESIQTLAEADRLAAELDVISVSEEAGSFLTNERERAYRGEDFERLMISVLQALNYAQLGQDEEALVEVRRVNERLEKMIVEEKKPYEQLAIARYIGGVLYEDQREWDSAYIDYAKALEQEPGLGVLAEPLLRLAKKTGRLEEYERLRRRFPDVWHEPLGAGEGQVLVVVEAGLSPEKEPADRRLETHDIIQVPVYRDRGRPGQAHVWVRDSGQRTMTVTSLADVAKVHLNERIGRMLARQVAGAVVKAGLAAGAGALTKSREVGALAFLVLNAMNQPDLRSWMSLPAEFQLARFRLPAGRHTVTVEASGLRTEREVEVEPGRVRVLVVRHYD
ncbi:hypothetical protein [Archangium sp.]|uniref:COG3014 family protein n=1 Tax=Archangium sp. TaxID=1872627 RepID=UPI002D516A1E|nr:hypothetical protein [Archangium sp.]HYO51996.1 hypothetical protein [Archangium sp.]